jgi:hypothetical protein
LGNTAHALAHYQQANDYQQQRLILAREIGARQEEGNALGGLGNAAVLLAN